MPAANADVVRANTEAFSRRDVETMLDLFAPDAVVRDRRTVGWGDFHGRDAIRAYYEGLFDNADKIYEDLAVVSEQADAVVASCRVTAHLVGQAEADVVTFDYAHFEQYLLGPYFPSFEARDKERFPDERGLEHELLAAGFESARLIRLSQREEVTKESLLARIRGRHISTFHLIDDDEYRAGLERAERELPETAVNRLEWLIAVAVRRTG